MVPGICGEGGPGPLCRRGDPRKGLRPGCVVTGVRAGPGLITATPSLGGSCISGGGSAGECGGEPGPTNMEELVDGGSVADGAGAGPP